jgi:uncharacterized protein YraI
MRKFMLVTALAVVAMPGVPVPAARINPGYTVRATRMMAGPDYDYPTVRRISRDAQISIYGCLSDRSWCDAAYRSDRGWIEGHDLVIVDRGRRLGISSYVGIGVLAFIFGSYWEDHYRSRPFYGERPRWEQRYYNNYQPHWGPRPSRPPSYQQPSYQQPDRQPMPQARPVPQRRDDHPNDVSNRITSPMTDRHETVRAQPAPARQHEIVRPQQAPDHERGNAKAQQGPTEQRGNQKNKDQHQPDNGNRKHDGQ